MKISDRLRSVPMSGIRRMFDLAGKDSVNLGLGEPDLAPPPEAIEGMRRACSEGRNKYGPTAGIPELREAVASRYPGLGGGNVMITQSGTSAILLAAQSLIDPGDEVLVPDPGFVVYGPHSMLSGGRVVGYGLTGDMVPDVDDIQQRITGRTKVMFVNSPSNPTGGVLDRGTYDALCDIASDNGIAVISDEVYEPFVYDGEHHSFASRLDRAVVINGFSKMMAVTGWRLGYVVASEEMMDHLIRMNYHMCASPNMPAQYGVLNAMPAMDRYLEDARKVFRARRDLVYERISGIDGMHMEPPKGAFYAFPSYDLDMRSEDLAMELAKNGLICTPGSSFGENGEHHLRFSYAADEDKINNGMDILSRTMEMLR